MDKLRDWFLDHQRDLPWRENRVPYRVWISEVMLQQTQVAVVIPYFHRWMQKFPTARSLAEAPLEEVMKAWEGLGYYSRARNLHLAAQRIVAEHGGELPSDPEKLAELPGFGPYTVGAVLSFAFRQRAPAVDGNVIRVLSRYFASEVDASKRNHFEELARAVLPEEEPWVVMEGLIELGATVCQKKPRCRECPLKEECRAFRECKADLLPVKKKRAETIYLERQVAVIRWGDEVLVRQEKEAKVMAGLYEFPYASLEENFNMGLQLIKLMSLPLVKHGFTRYDVTLYPSLYKAEEKLEITGFEWKTWNDLAKLPFSSGHRRILENLRNENFTH
jgi:A/G-specific adenine glycosylase